MSLQPVHSSAIAAVGYDGSTLAVRFRGSGRIYLHHRVPESVYAGLVTASSIGAYYNRHIRRRYP
ncbi:MAG: KTSC domain-containing protein [Limisphaerales bacterium]